jgi:hypothetical protein
MNDPQLMFFLKVTSGIFWSLVYVCILIRGYRDKTYGMPMIALCANISWEFIFSFVFPHAIPQIYVNIVWFSLDFLILVQFIKYGKNEYQTMFRSGLLATLIISFLIVLSITIEFKDWFGKYAAFSQNLLMSIMFIIMLKKRDNIQGQSLYIAIFKMAGTLCASILFAIYYPSLLIIMISALTFGFDCIYTIMLYQKFNDLGVNPWTRITGKVSMGGVINP